MAENGRAQRLPRRGHFTGNPARLILVALVAWALAMILPGLYRVVEPLASFGLVANNDGVILDVVTPFETANQSPAALAGLVPGDQIDLQQMRCTIPTSPACSSVVAVLGGLGGLQYVLPGREIDLAIRRGQGEFQIVHLRAAAARLGWPVRLLLLADTIVGVLFVAAACRLVWIQPGRMTWGFFLYAIWFNPGQSYTYYTLLQLWPTAVLAQELMEALAQGAAYAGLLTFALRFPTEAPDLQWRRGERVLPLVGAAIALLTLLSAGNLFGVPTERITQAIFLGGFVIDVIVIVVLIWRRRHQPPADEQRMRWAIAGCAIGLPAFNLAAICQSSGLLEDLWGATLSQTTVGALYLLHGVLAYFIGVAVRRRRVVSVSIPLRHGTITTALTLLLGVPVVYLHEQVAEYQEGFHLPEWIWPMVIAPVMLVVFNRLHEFAVELVDHVLNPHFHRAQHRLRLAGRAMLTAGSFTEIDRLLVEEPAQTLRLSSAAVFRWMDGALRRADPAIGWENAALRELQPDDDTLVLQSIALGVPIRLRHGQWRRSGLPADDRSPCLALPVRSGTREGIALALLGPHEVGTDINVDEREMLQELARDAGLAYDRVETELLRREVLHLRAQLVALANAPDGQAI